MRSTQRLLRSANPVPADRRAPLTARAHDELQALVGQAGGPAAGRRRRPVRMVVLAATASVVVAIAGLAVVVALRASEPPPPTADQPFYASTDALEDRADAIVRATLDETREQDRQGFAETVATASVRLTAKGDAAPGEQIEVSYPTPGSGPETPVDLTAGGEYVLLLVLNPDGSAHLVNTTQGYYPISGGEATAGPDNPVPLSPGVRAALQLG